jgi:hypothetical protein
MEMGTGTGTAMAMLSKRESDAQKVLDLLKNPFRNVVRLFPPFYPSARHNLLSDCDARE